MSRRILLVSHGRLASGIRSSIEILTRMSDQVDAIDAYVDQSDWTQALARFLDSCGPGDEVVIFSDLLGGSVCQKVALALADRPDVLHVTGMNLGLVIETLLWSGPLDRRAMEEIAANARQTLTFVGPTTDEGADEATQADDADFFG